MQFIMSLTGGDNIFRIDQTFEKIYKKGKPEFNEIFQVTHFKNRQVISKQNVKNWNMIKPWIRNLTDAGYKVHRL